MNKLFYFSPDCHITVTKKEFLAYDTISYESVYIADVHLPAPELNTLREYGYLVCDSCSPSLIEECIRKRLGYLIEYNSTLPFFHNRKIRFLTSLQKERRALGCNLPSYTNLMLKSLTILLNNSRKDDLDEYSYCQLEYPQKNNEHIDIRQLIRNIEPFIGLEVITLAGELHVDQIKQLMDYAGNKGLSVTYRLFYDACLPDTLEELLTQYKDLYIELLVDHNTPTDFYVRIDNHKLHYRYIVYNLNEIQSAPNQLDLTYTPIFKKKARHNELKKAMLIRPDEVLNTRKSLRECQVSSYVNSEQFGHLVLDPLGNVSCLNQFIGSIQKNTLQALLSGWIASSSCIWYYTRSKKRTCRNCALQALCPPITIYEQIGLFTCPCKL